MRVSDTDRDDIAAHLREAAAEGRITFDELDERLDRTYAAQVYADLEPIVADLPPAGAAPGGAVAPASGVGAPVDRGQPMVINAKGDDIVRKGDWEVPARIEVNNSWGSCRLDFREARLTSPVTEVWIDASAGSGDFILPEGATAEIDVDASWFGSIHNRVDSIRKQGVPHFVVTGVAKGGSITLRYKRSSGFMSLFGG